MRFARRESLSQASRGIRRDRLPDIGIVGISKEVSMLGLRPVSMPPERKHSPRAEKRAPQCTKDAPVATLTGSAQLEKLDSAFVTRTTVNETSALSLFAKNQ